MFFLECSSDYFAIICILVFQGPSTLLYSTLFFLDPRNHFLFIDLPYLRSSRNSVAGKKPDKANLSMSEELSLFQDDQRCLALKKKT